MPFTSLVLLTLLWGVIPQASSTATVKAGGHVYQLYCRQEDEDILASETGLCEKTESAGLQRLEVRNEFGDVQFSQDAPAGKPFSYAAIFLFANAGQEILDVDTSQDEIHGSGSKPTHVIYYLDPTPSGLVPFDPPLVDVDGFARVSAGVALSRTFDTGFFQFSVLLDFHVAGHRIEIIPEQIAFSAFPPAGWQKSGPSSGSGDIKLYSSHDSAAPKADIRIAPGHTVSWWQSPGTGGKPAAGQVVMILAAWAPASLKPADNGPDGVKMVYYDPNDLWLQIQVDDHTGWIRGTRNFRMIGLEMITANR